MFSLIITTIAVVLVAILGVATVYYGGTTFRLYDTKAKAAQVVLEGQQISAAVDVYRTKNNGALPTSMADLTNNGEYLRSNPNAGWSFDATYVITPMTDIAACKKANSTLGIELADIPLCSAVKGRTICCQAD